MLANEQVVDGACWRCGTTVVARDLEQWFFRITAYADELLKGLDTLTEWPEKVVVMQRNWIGRSEGARIKFPVAGAHATAIEVFTTRIDTIYGATFVLLAPEHPMVDRFAAESARSGGVPRARRGVPRARSRGAAAPARSRRKASTPAARRSIRSRARKCRSGSPTSCWPSTAPARSWPCRRTISATSSSRGSTACRSGSSSCRPATDAARGRRDDRGRRPTTAASSIRASTPGRKRRPSSRG